MSLSAPMAVRIQRKRERGELREEAMVNKTKIERCDYTANPIRYRRADDPTGQRGSLTPDPAGKVSASQGVLL